MSKRKAKVIEIVSDEEEEVEQEDDEEEEEEEEVKQPKRSKRATRKAAKPRVYSHDTDEEEEEEEEEEIKIKKKKTAAKKVPSDYVGFCKEERAELKREFPDMKTKDIAKEVNARWKLVNEKYEAMDTRFDEIPPELLTNILDYIPVGSRSALNLRTCSSQIDACFREHRHYPLYQYKFSVPQMMKYLSDNSNLLKSHQIDSALNLSSKSQEFIHAVSLLEHKKKIWEEWVVESKEYEHPMGVSLTQSQRQTVFDNLYSRVNFEMMNESTEFNHRGNYSSNVTTGRIRIGNDFLISYTFSQDDNEILEGSFYQRKRDLTIKFLSVRGKPVKHISFDWEHRYPRSKTDGGVLNKVRDTLGLNQIRNDNDFIDLLTFALPFNWLERMDF